MKELLKCAILAAVEAGKAIVKIYESENFQIEFKGDSSPLTRADKAAHNIIEKYLLETDIPILSEEGNHEGYEIRKHWKRLWIVDPLDGTKEFIKRTGEFTVNIALIEDGYPIAGVVFVPVTQTLYYGDVDNGSFKIVLNSTWRQDCAVDIVKPKKLPISIQEQNFKVVASVSHLSKETENFVDILKEKYGAIDFLSIGSSLKICKIAEGSADIYPRLGPTMEWDTAAGQAIAECAGMRFINWYTKQRFNYNRAELLNNWFVVVGEKVKQRELIDLIEQFKY